MAERGTSGRSAGDPDVFDAGGAVAPAKIVWLDWRSMTVMCGVSGALAFDDLQGK